MPPSEAGLTSIEPSKRYGRCYGTIPRVAADGMGSPEASAISGNQARVRLQAAHTEGITGTSMSTPTTVAKAAPEPGPNKAMAVATAGSKKLLAPIKSPRPATSAPKTKYFVTKCSNAHQRRTWVSASCGFFDPGSTQTQRR